MTTDVGASCDVIFKPPGVRRLKFTGKGGAEVSPDSYACLDCGTVWSHTDAAALGRFIAANCKHTANEKADA